MNKSFQFYCPIEKSEEATDSDRIVRGLASCEAVDQQGEVIFQKGINAEPLLKTGWVNFDHSSSPDDIIGIPLKVEISEISTHPVMSKSGLKGIGFYTEARLLTGQPRAEAVWQLMKALKGTSRSLAWSVQGGVLERSQNQLLRTEIRHLAITHQPVLSQSFAEIAKSLTTASSAPMMLEQIDAGKKLNIYGKCDDSHYDRNGVFKGGVKTFIEHLMFCKGFNLDTSKDIAASVISNPKYFRKVYSKNE